MAGFAWFSRWRTAAPPLLALAMAALTPACSGAAPAASPQPSRLIERTFFAMHVHWLNQDVRLALPPVGSLRLWDTRTMWAQLEPRKGEWDFRRMDKFVELARTLDADVLLTLGGTPRWAAARPDQPNPFGPGASSEARVAGDWDDYVRAVATRYRGRIKYYEVINEPTVRPNKDACLRLSTFYCATPRELVELTTRTQRVVRSADPAAIVHSPGFVHHEYVEGYIKAGASPAAYDIHIYPQQTSARQLARWNEFKAVLAAVGKPNATLWSTEGGLPTKADGLGEDEPYIPTAEQPGAVARYLTLAASIGIGRVYYYTWDDRIYGLSDDLGTAPGITGTGYLRTMSWLLGARIAPCAADANVWRCELTRGTTKATIVWHDAAGERTVDMAGRGGAAFAHRMDGSVKPLGTGLLKVGREPVVVTYGTAKWGAEQKFVKL